MEPKLLFYLILFLSTTCFDNVFYVRWMDIMTNYTLFAGGILFPLSGLLFFAIPMFYLKRKGKITPDNTSKIVNHKDLFIIACFDSSNSIIQSIATPYLSVLSVTVFNRLSLVGIPIASKIFLDTKYRINHYLGIFLTIYAISITFIPDILEHKEIANGWLLLYIFGILPSIGSFIYKEKRLAQNPDIWWFNTWVCLYQVIIGMILLPFNIIILSSHDDTYSFRNFDKQLTYGFMCQFADKNMQEGDDCKGAFGWFMIYSLLSTIMNTLMLIIIREGSSVLFVITNTVKVPLTAFLGSFSALAGKGTSKITIADIYAFILLIVGSIVYNYKNEIKPQKPILFEEFIPIGDHTFEKDDVTIEMDNENENENKKELL